MGLFLVCSFSLLNAQNNGNSNNNGKGNGRQTSQTTSATDGQVLTRVNWGASWDNPYSAGSGLEMDGNEFRQMKTVQDAIANATTKYDGSDVIIIGSVANSNIKLIGSNTNLYYEGKILTVVNQKNTAYSICCSGTFVDFNGNSTSFPANSSITIRWDASANSGNGEWVRIY